MERIRIEQCLVTFILVVSFLFEPAIGYTSADTENVRPHLEYMWSHANVWHLAGNLLCLWLIRRKLYLCSSLVIAFLASFIPAFSIYGDVGVTLGFSGVLFAIVGTKWGVYCRICRQTHIAQWKNALSQFMIRILPFALLGILIPHVNWCLHTYCLLAGFAYGWFRR